MTNISKAEFLEMVRVERARLYGLIEKMNEASLLIPVDEGGWTVKDMIAHLSWHEREMLGMLRQKALRGSELWNEPLDKRNRAIFELNRDRPLEEVRAEADEIYPMLVKELEALEEEDLHDPGRFAEMPMEWQPWQILADNTYEHYQAHSSWLQDWFNKNSFDE